MSSERVRKPRLTNLVLDGLEECVNVVTADDLGDMLASGNISSIPAVQAADRWLEAMRAYLASRTEPEAANE